MMHALAASSLLAPAAAGAAIGHAVAGPPGAMLGAGTVAAADVIVHARPTHGVALGAPRDPLRSGSAQPVGMTVLLLDAVEATISGYQALAEGALVAGACWAGSTLAPTPLGAMLGAAVGAAIAATVRLAHAAPAASAAVGACTAPR